MANEIPSREYGFFRRIWEAILQFFRNLFGGGGPAPAGPSITSINPTHGYAGSLVTIHGDRFDEVREQNKVTFNGVDAYVISASTTELQVIVHAGTDTGPVKITVDGLSDTGPDFTILPYPNAGAGEDGPPVHFAGTGNPGAAGGVSPTGTAKVLVSIVYPSDQTPANPANLRQDIIDIWDNVTTFYDQASFNTLTVDVDILSAWHELSGNQATYYKANGAAGYPNIDWGVIDRLMAEAAQAAVDDGFDLNDYDMMACVINLNGTFIRAWGGFSRQNFSYKNTSAGLDINITLDDPVPLMVVGEDANWGRCAHEFGHNLVDQSGASITDRIGGFTLGEDVYRSDLIDSSEATATQFEMMGSHDSHPLFSGYYMDQLGYYDDSDPEHIRTLNWDRNPFSNTFKIVAHGLSKNTAADRCHLVRIKVGDGLYYYIEVRQKPGTTTQIFDDSIPVGTAPNDGGVVVTRVLTDTVNINQQTRFITLLHDEVVLKDGETAVDPARDLTITVEDDGVVNRPLVCSVKVEWAQEISDDPDGRFDLNLEPWDSNWQTPDIWVDRDPYNSFDQANDSEGRPQGNGDKPRPAEINRFYTRVHNDGADAASNVKVTFYSVEPPGVGDNGNWSPIKTENISNINADDYKDIYVNWVPVVDRHTCLKVFINQQLGEITGGNNSAQENVFDFEAPASSVPLPVTMPVAVRNPLESRVCVHLSSSRVPQGYAIYFSHRWIWLDAKKERKIQMTIIPTEDYGWYTEFRKIGMTTHIGLKGDIPRGYSKKVDPGTVPASWAFPIGGVTMSVTPKRKVSLDIQAEGERDTIYTTGKMEPAMANEKVRIDYTDQYGFRNSFEVLTDSNGNFSHRFALEKFAERNSRLVKEDPEHLPEKHTGTFPVWGDYRVQAHTINSPNAAQASSNVVKVTVQNK